MGNGNNTNILCTARVYLAPKYDERGSTWMYDEQRHMMIELDRFVISCTYQALQNGQLLTVLLC